MSTVPRALLSADGTTTELLERGAAEPVEAMKLRHVLEPADRVVAGALSLAMGAPVLGRTVVLRGITSERPFLYADAAIAVERLDDRFLDDLWTTSEPIGRLLAEHGIATCREILTVGCEPAGSPARHLGIRPSDPIFVRTYRITNGGRRVMLITERIPVGVLPAELLEDTALHAE